MIDALRQGLVEAPSARVLEDSATFSVAFVSSRGELLAANKAFQGLLRYESFSAMRGKSFPRELLSLESEWIKWWSSTMPRGGLRQVSAECVAADGQRVPVRGVVERVKIDSGEEVLRAVLVDDSAPSTLRDLSMRMARIEGALTLAAGVSHDFNNLLTILVGNLFLVSEHVRADPPLHEKVRKARDAAKRGAELVRQLVQIARGAGADTAPAVVDLGRLLQSLAPLLTSVVGSRIAFQTTVASDLPPVLADRAQLESVISNLVINARDAVAEVAQGQIFVSVESRQLPAAAAQAHGVEPGTYLRLSVRDNGCGIPEEVAGRVFEPFFSTKPRGRGTGLGLPMVRWFAEKSGGAVSLASRPGAGTEVAVLLPANAAEPAETTVSTVALGLMPGGSERVAIVSDDHDFRSTVAEMLSALGYVVVSAGARFLRSENDSATVFVVDAASSAAARLLRALRERAVLGVVVVGEAAPHGPGDAPSAPKPFTPIELARAVRSAIEGPT
jgi:signal transduction histidine kinase